jgi:hypothetical protein
MLEKGKRIYTTSMLWPVKLLLLAIVLFFYHDLYIATFMQEKFIQDGRFSFFDVLQFHWRYPTELFVTTAILLPTFFYYAFLRGVIFYERGLLYNRGVPFLNTWISYEECSSYRLIAPNSLVALSTKAGDFYLITTNNMERVLGILDQHELKGELGSEGYVKLVNSLKRFIYLVGCFTLLLYLAVKLGLFRVID